MTTYLGFHEILNKRAAEQCKYR